MKAYKNYNFIFKENIRISISKKDNLKIEIRVENYQSLSVSLIQQDLSNCRGINCLNEIFTKKSWN